MQKRKKIKKANQIVSPEAQGNLPPGQLPAVRRTEPFRGWRRRGRWVSSAQRIHQVIHVRSGAPSLSPPRVRDQAPPAPASRPDPRGGISAAGGRGPGAAARGWARPGTSRAHAAWPRLLAFLHRASPPRAHSPLREKPYTTARTPPKASPLPLGTCSSAGPDGVGCTPARHSSPRGEERSERRQPRWPPLSSQRQRHPRTRAASAFCPRQGHAASLYRPGAGWAGARPRGFLGVVVLPS